MSGGNGRYRLTREERKFEEFLKWFSLEIFSLEILYSEEIKQGIHEALDKKQAEFDRMMESRSETIAEKTRWKKNREETEQRKAAHERGSVPVPRAVRQLARRWGAKLVLQGS